MGHHFKYWRGPILAGAAWSALALLTVWLTTAGAVLIVWLPSGIAVAALYAVPKRDWPRVIAVLAAFQFPTLLWTTGSWSGAIGYTLSSQIEAVLCSVISIKILGGRKQSPRTFAHVGGLFGGAVLCSGVAAFVALPFQPVANLHELAWRFLATVLGVLAGTPVILRLRQWLGFGDQSVRIWSHQSKPFFSMAIVGLFALGCAVCATPVIGLTPVLVVAVVFTVIRYGQLSAAAGVLAFAAAATIVSLGGRSPVAGWPVAPAVAAVTLQAQMLLMLAAALPIAAMLLGRERLQAKLAEHNRKLRDGVTILSLAESLVGIGRWRYDVRTGRQEWSPLMLALHGLAPELGPDPGNVRTLLPDNGAELFGHFAAHRDDREPYGFDYRMVPAAGDERILRMHVTNEFDEDGVRIAMFAVAMDVTEQVRREDALRVAREQAITQAAASQKLANTDPLTGLANRRATFDWLNRLIEASNEVDEPLALVMFDIDHFKRINDQFGHPTGDRVLTKIAGIARGVMRGDDLVGRIGGEEFVCVLPSVQDAPARALAERLCRAVDSSGDLADGLPRATISLGVALLRAGDSGDTLLARADAALYEAKDAGRNQVRRAA